MKLYEHQRRAIESLPDRAGIWHEPGLGKSATSIGLCKARVRGRVLVVCPKSLRRNWFREISMWDPDGAARYKVVTKEEFRRDWDSLDAPEAVVIDEAHYHASCTSQLHKATLKFMKKHKPRFVWAATATPVLASVMSVWGLSLILGRPLGNYMTFQYRYFKKVLMGFREIPVQRDGIEAQIAADLRSIGDAVSKDDALDLPDTVHLTEHFQMTPEQRRAVKSLDQDPTTSTPIVYHTKCLQIANGTLKKADGTYDVIHCEKMSRVVDLAAEHRRLVIVCRQTAELDVLSKRIPGSMVYSGSTPVEERDAILERANRGDGILLLQADMGIGFNLVGVSVMVFYSASWDYIKYEQCLGRIHRIGQRNKCTYIHLITEGTIDEDVHECLQRKESFQIELYKKKR